MLISKSEAIQFLKQKLSYLLKNCLKVLKRCEGHFKKASGQKKARG
jgi:hypothetical protein